jgi:hemerythrin-like domain-containing protein
MDCIVLLTHHHQGLERLFSTLEEGDLSVVPEICVSLERHLLVEGGAFYPAVVNEVNGTAAEVAASIEEHRQMRHLIRELAEFTAIDEAYVTKARDLVAVVREHVIDEESELYPRVGAALSEGRRAELGCEIEQLHRSAAAREEELGRPPDV